MIDIKLTKSFLETYFRNQENYDVHLGKHVTGEDDYDFQMDEMDKEVYNELGNRLSLAYCGDLYSNYQIIGYVADNGLSTKFDKDSGLCVVFDYDRDETVSLYKTTLEKVIGKACGESNSDKRFMWAGDIPRDEVGTGSFDYEEFMKEFELQKRKEFAIAPNSITYTAIFVPEDKMATIRKLYSQNELEIKPEYPHITIDYIGKLNNSDRARVQQVAKEISKFGTEVKFKVIGYANDGKNEGVKVSLLQVPDEIKPLLDDNFQYHITLSYSSDSKAVKTGLLDFEEVDDKIKSKGIFGGFSKQNKSPFLSPKNIIKESRGNRIYYKIIKG